jgi:hypothetical protein
LGGSTGLVCRELGFDRVIDGGATYGDSRDIDEPLPRGSSGEERRGEPSRCNQPHTYYVVPSLNLCHKLLSRPGRKERIYTAKEVGGERHKVVYWTIRHRGGKGQTCVYDGNGKGARAEK